MIIYFRACEKQQTISNLSRFKKIDKTTILKKSWMSIQQSINDTDTVIIIEDQVSKETIDWMLNNNNSGSIEIVSVPEHVWGYHQHTVTLVETLEKMCVNHPTKLHYIVEDDYLHTNNAIRVMEDTLANWPNFAVSYDYPDRYKDPRPCHVVLGKDRHWRTIDSCTMTVVALGARWLDIMPELKNAAPTSNDRMFEDIFKQIPCLSPMPSLSAHLTDYHLSPLVDWEKEWQNQKI